MSEPARVASTLLKRRSTGRFVLALVVSFVVYGLSFTKALALGHAVLGGPGMVAAVVVLGFVLALLYSAVYDGPRAVARLFPRGGRRHRRPQAS